MDVGVETDMSNKVGFKVRQVYLAIAVGVPSLVSTSQLAEAKTPGQTYCFLSVCHRVLTLAETKAAIGKPRSMHASHYDDPSVDRFNPSLITSSGELFRPGAPNNAASPIYPDGTLVAVFAPATKRGAIVRINNAGPYFGNRMIDLSRGLAHKLGITGVGRVLVEVLVEPRPKDAVYARGRKYPPVAGYIGTVASVETVRDQWRASQAPRGPTLAQMGPKPPAVVAAAATAWAPFSAAQTPSFQLLDRHLSVLRPDLNAIEQPPRLPAPVASPVAMARRTPVLAAREVRPQSFTGGHFKVAKAAPLQQ
jgi:rare lipoprotein A